MSECRVCGGRTPKAKSVFCGRACFLKSVAVVKKCAGCEETLPRSKKVYCTNECKIRTLTGRGHVRWQGGKWERADGVVFVWTDKIVSTPSGRRRAEREHRVVAAKSIGRRLEPWEMIIHISREMDDNRPDNLFICGSRSEYSRRRQGGLPWPDHSNLGAYDQPNPRPL